MEAIANTILGILFVLCALTVLSGISVLIKLAVVILTIGYGLVWWHYAD